MSCTVPSGRLERFSWLIGSNGPLRATSFLSNHISLRSTLRERSENGDGKAPGPSWIWSGPRIVQAPRRRCTRTLRRDHRPS
jgi:hypothetical protein